MRLIILEAANYLYCWSYQGSLPMSLILFILSFITFQFRFVYTESRFLSQFKLSFVCRAIRIKYFSFSNKFILLEGAINNSSICKLESSFSLFDTLFIIALVGKKFVWIAVQTWPMPHPSNRIYRPFIILML